MGDTDEWLQLERLLAKASASRFDLSQAEFATFDGWWALSAPARDKRKSLATETHAEIREAFVRLAAIVNDGAVYKAEVGYRHISRVPATGRFVIFSDHHMGFAGAARTSSTTPATTLCTRTSSTDTPRPASRSSRTATSRSS